jgi:FAD/FMN-containing dehydrogenase
VVSRIINILREQKCIFAVKSGGHSVCVGASAIHEGVVIDLSKLNDIQVSSDESTVSVGTGCRWGDVYSQLDGRGLSAIGGRVGSVGVGGFTLGGKLICILCRV